MEGSGRKQPYAIARQEGEVMAFAGLWEGWKAPDGEIWRTFAIVTTGANAQMAELHDRMPVILEPADWPAWLGETEGDPTTLLYPARWLPSRYRGARSRVIRLCLPGCTVASAMAE
jgi:putative SOS response-associated peptidase YedK